MFIVKVTLQFITLLNMQYNEYMTQVYQCGQKISQSPHISTIIQANSNLIVCASKEILILNIYFFILKKLRINPNSTCFAKSCNSSKSKIQTAINIFLWVHFNTQFIQQVCNHQGLIVGICISLQAKLHKFIAFTYFSLASTLKSSLASGKKSLTLSFFFVCFVFLFSVI